MSRPFESFVGAQNNFIDLLFTDAYSPQDRKKLYQREYLRRGLVACNGKREKTAIYLGMCERTLRKELNKHPDLIAQFPIFNKAHVLYQKKKSEYLVSVKDYWHPSKREVVVNNLKKIAKECGVGFKEEECPHLVV